MDCHVGLRNSSFNASRVWENRYVTCFRVDFFILIKVKRMIVIEKHPENYENTRCCFFFHSLFFFGHYLCMLMLVCLSWSMWVHVKQHTSCTVATMNKISDSEYVSTPTFFALGIFFLYSVHGVVSLMDLYFVEGNTFKW